MTTPVAIHSVGELRRRTLAGHSDFAIMLAGGAFISRKEVGINPCDFHEADAQAPVCSDPACVFVVINGIDGSEQEMTADGLWTESNIGEALTKNALLDMEGDVPDDRVAVLDGKGGIALESPHRYHTVNVTVEDQDGELVAVWRSSAPFPTATTAIAAGWKVVREAVLDFDRMDE